MGFFKPAPPFPLTLAMICGCWKSFWLCLTPSLVHNSLSFLITKFPFLLVLEDRIRIKIQMTGAVGQSSAQGAKSCESAPWAGGIPASVMGGTGGRRDSGVPLKSGISEVCFTQIAWAQNSGVHGQPAVEPTWPSKPRVSKHWSCQRWWPWHSTNSDGAFPLCWALHYVLYMCCPIQYSITPRTGAFALPCLPRW